MNYLYYYHAVSELEFEDDVCSVDYVQRELTRAVKTVLCTLFSCLAYSISYLLSTLFLVSYILLFIFLVFS